MVALKSLAAALALAAVKDASTPLKALPSVALAAVALVVNGPSVMLRLRVAVLPEVVWPSVT